MASWKLSFLEGNTSSNLVVTNGLVYPLFLCKNTDSNHFSCLFWGVVKYTLEIEEINVKPNTTIGYASGSPSSNHRRCKTKSMSYFQIIISYNLPGRCRIFSWIVHSVHHWFFSRLDIFKTPYPIGGTSSKPSFWVFMLPALLQGNQRVYPWKMRGKKPTSRAI